MKLLLDQNLSRRPVDSLAALWPGTSHVRHHGLERATDRQLWEFAAKEGYCLVSKDGDFLNLAMVRGAPPKVIIVRTGNAVTTKIYDCLRSREDIINAFDKDTDESVLLIP